MSWIDIAGHLSFILTAASFTLRDMLLLRGVSILSGVVGLVYNYNLPDGPLWLVIFWLSIFMSINSCQIVAVLLRQRRRLTEDEEALSAMMPGLSSSDIARLMSAASWSELPVGAVLIEEGRELEELILLCVGEVSVSCGGREIARVVPSMFLGEMSFLRGTAAMASVVTVAPTRCLVWPAAGLRGVLESLSADLCEKLRAA